MNHRIILFFMKGLRKIYENKRETYLPFFNDGDDITFTIGMSIVFCGLKEAITHTCTYTHGRMKYAPFPAWMEMWEWDIRKCEIITNLTYKTEKKMKVWPQAEVIKWTIIEVHCKYISYERDQILSALPHTSRYSSKIEYPYILQNYSSKQHTSSFSQELSFPLSLPLPYLILGVQTYPLNKKIRKKWVFEWIEVIMKGGKKRGYAHFWRWD